MDKESWQRKFHSWMSYTYKI